MRKVVLRYLAKTILSYLAVILLVIVLLFPIYQTAYEATEKVIKSDITYDIRQRLNNLSDELESIELYVESIKSESSLVTLAYLPDTNHSHLISARELQKSLRDTMFSLSVLVDDVIIFCGQSDYVITQSGTEQRSAYYGTTVRYDDLTKQEYEEILLAGKQTLLPIQHVYTRNLGFEQPALTINYFSDTTTQAFYSFSFLIKESTLTKRLVTPLVSQYGSLVITDEAGNLLYTYGEQQNSHNTQQIDISDDSGSYHAALTLDNAAFSESIRSVQQTIATYVIIAVLVCSIFCGVMIIRMIRPLKEYISFVDRYYDGNNPAAYSKTLQDCLQQSMQGMIVRGDMLEKQLKNMQERYLHSILSNVAAGVRVNQQELTDHLAEEKIFNAPYLMARMYLDPGENAQSVRQREEWIEMVRQHLLAACPEAVIVPVPRFIALLPVGNTPEAVMELLHSEAEELSVQTDRQCQVYFMVSGVHRGAEEYPTACHECHWLRQNMMLMQPEKRLVFAWSADLTQTSSVDEETISFGGFQVENFCAVLSGGEVERCDIFLEKIIRPQFTLLAVQKPERAEAFYYVLVDAMEAIARRNGIGYSAPLFQPDATCDELISQIQQDVHRLCETLSANKPHSDGKAAIITYIDEHFRDSDLCLNKLSTEYNLSVSYISRMIKQHTGKTYGDYVETLRMEEAVRLLSNTDMLVSDIATVLGYENQNTFFKAFKRFYQVAPGAFRGGTRK